MDSQNIYDTQGNLIGLVNYMNRPIYATEEGVVVAAGSSDFGNYVVVRHIIRGTAFYSIYAHLDKANVSIGAYVDNTVQIGAMGNTIDQDSGGTTVVHLHFEVRESINIDLSQTNPFGGKVWWPGTRTELEANFVDLGLTAFGSYSDHYYSMPK